MLPRACLTCWSSNGLSSNLSLGPSASLLSCLRLCRSYKGNAAALGILADIAALPNLTQLSTRGCGWLWAAGVPALAVAPLAARLTSLSVAACGPGFGDAAVAAVAMLTLMESLDLSNTAVTPAGGCYSGWLMHQCRCAHAPGVSVHAGNAVLIRGAHACMQQP